MLSPDALEPLTMEQQQIIDSEHIRLANSIEEILRECYCFNHSYTRSHCSHEDHGMCLGRLPSQLHCFYEIVAEHFQSEEQILSGKLITSAAHEYFKHHKTDHDRILNLCEVLVGKAVHDCRNGMLFSALKRFQDTIHYEFVMHQHAYDSLMK